jgi:pimeloyl-ACP methyl ester carboxylesterase
VSEEPFYLSNRRGHQLFAVLNRGGSTTPPLGVVLCHPLGEEKQFSYRPYVKLARFLEQRGFASIRFDCFGFGDSEGDLREASVESQIEDTLDAIACLRSQANVEQLVLFGVRFGATIAALTALRDARIQGVGLVAPIVNGSQYWGQMLTTRRMGEVTGGTRPKKADELMQELGTNGALEIGAQWISSKMVDELCRIDLVRDVKGFDGRVFLTTPKDLQGPIEQGQALLSSYQADDCSCTWHQDLERDLWSQQCMYDRYVPTDLFEQFHMWLNTCL